MNNQRLAHFLEIHCMMVSFTRTFSLGLNDLPSKGALPDFKQF
jgi:hypothetical protein